MQRRYGELPGYGGDSRPLHKMIQLLQLRIRKKPVDLVGTFQSFDKLNKGRVPNSRFQSIINTTDLLSLSDDEVGSFVMAYPHKNEPGLIDYRRFCADIEYGTSVPARFMPDEEEYPAVPAYMQRAAQAAMVEIASFLAYQNLHKDTLVNAFVDNDKFNTGCVTAHLFGSALARIGVQLTPKQLTNLVEVYKINKPGEVSDVLAGGGCQVNYKQFCNDMLGTRVERYQGGMITQTPSHQLPPAGARHGTDASLGLGIRALHGVGGAMFGTRSSTAQLSFRPSAAAVEEAASASQRTVDVPIFSNGESFSDVMDSQAGHPGSMGSTGGRRSLLASAGAQQLGGMPRSNNGEYSF